MPSGLPLLPNSSWPDSKRALLAAVVLFTGGGDRFVEHGPYEPVAIERREPALVASGRPITLNGFAPANRKAPLVLVAARTDARPGCYDALTRHLASHGFATLVLAREPDELWTHYADALALTARQLFYEAQTPDHPWSRVLLTRSLALIADGDAETAGARAAASVPGLRAFVTLDGDDAGVALPWLDRLKAPFLYVGAGDDEAAVTMGLASWRASGAERGQRWRVRMHAAGPLVGGEGTLLRPVERDGQALVARFLEAELAAGSDPVSLRDLDKLGIVERDCQCGVAAAPQAMAAKK